MCSQSMAQNKYLVLTTFLCNWSLVVKQLIEILALGKDIKVNTLLMGKNVLEAKKYFLENLVQHFKINLGVSTFYLVVYRTEAHCHQYFSPNFVSNARSCLIFFRNVASVCSFRPDRYAPHKEALLRGRSPYNVQNKVFTGKNFHPFLHMILVFLFKDLLLMRLYKVTRIFYYFLQVNFSTSHEFYFL